MNKYKRTIRFFIIFFILLFLFLWDDILSGNEAQTLANTYHFAHPSWLANDWFLSLDTVYRIPFNIFLFPLAKILSLPALAVTSRILLITLMSVSLTRFFDVIKLTPGAIALFVVVTFRMKGMLAGEDMLWHVEAKVLSYILVISGITSYLKGNHRGMWLFFGGASTFHPLVGGYNVIAAIFSLFFLERKEKSDFLKTSPYFVFSGWPGIAIVLFNLISSRKASGGIADLIYVARHPHHMLPADFFRHVHKGFPPWLDYTILIGNLIFCAAVLIIAFIKLEKYSKERKLLYFTFGSTLIFTGGLILYLTRQYHLLKYYPFRFPDVIIPFTSYTLFLYAADKFLFRKKPLIGTVIASLILAVSSVLFAIETKSYLSKSVSFALHDEKSADKEVYSWIYGHTPKNSVFIISPFIDNFNITAERAQFVTFKNIPQNEKDISSWYRRLKLLNKGKDFYDGKINMDLADYRKNYDALNDEELKKISVEYGPDYYIGPSERRGNLVKVYGNKKWGVYRLK